MIQYTGRILSECSPRIGAGSDVINARRSFDSELNGLLRCLHREHGAQIPAHVADECYMSCARLREQRVNRITALQSVYPGLHYAILMALALAECIAFIMETDQSVLVFLNSFQLKILWSILWEPLSLALLFYGIGGIFSQDPTRSRHRWISCIQSD